MEEKFYACILETPEGPVFYSFGKDHLETGLTDNDNRRILECTGEAYTLACQGKWDRIAVSGDKVAAAAAADTLNRNPPVVLALVPGRDF